MLTSPLAIRLRSMSRKLGLNSIIGSLISGNRYEDRFSLAFQSKIGPGDVVWDVGANVGLYTSIFSSATGPNGLVVAFEPTAACFIRLRERFSDSPKVVLKNIALGAADGVVSMQVDTDALAATHRVVTWQAAEQGLVSVDIRSAASLVRDEPGLFPNVVKIDVEGHEGAVLDGFETILPDRRLHCLGIEMHFGLLDERRESTRPKQIQQTLLRNGFSVQWTDPSHLLATR